MEALRHETQVADVVEVNVPDDATARSLGFLGSPSVRIDGIDIDPPARASKQFRLMCRTYSDAGKQVGIPPLDLIRRALREAANPQPAKGRVFLGASVIAAIGASLCCILPILAAVVGAGAITAGVAFEKWRPYLLGLTGLLLVGGVVLAWRDHKRTCAVGSLCATKPLSRGNYIALVILAAGVVALATFPYYSGAVAQVFLQQPPTHSVSSVVLSTVTFRVPDMDCPACAVALSASLEKLPGVTDAKLDVPSRQAVVTYDPAMQNSAELEKVISAAGFHVAPGPRS
jgi:mercuric ion transport protein